MAVTKEVSKIQWILTALEYKPDGTAVAVLTKGYTEDSLFYKLDTKTLHIAKVDVDIVLDAAPTKNTRRKDIGDAVYNFAITHGYITGTIV